MTTPPASWILSEDYAGLQAQALGLAEAAGLRPQMRPLVPRAPWKYFPETIWPSPLAAFPPRLLARPWPDLVIGCGGMASVVGAAMRRLGQTVVQVQNPSVNPDRFDLVVVNRHDELTGPNVIVTRTALHRATPARLAAAGEQWREPLRPSAAPAGRRPGRRLERAVPPGCGNRRPAGRATGRHGSP